eukprot:Rmarinus@m.14118
MPKFRVGTQPVFPPSPEKSIIHPDSFSHTGKRQNINSSNEVKNANHEFYRKGVAGRVWKDSAPRDAQSQAQATSPSLSTHASHAEVSARRAAHSRRQSAAMAQLSLPHDLREEYAAPTQEDLNPVMAAATKDPQSPSKTTPHLSRGKSESISPSKSRRNLLVEPDPPETESVKNAAVMAAVLKAIIRLRRRKRIRETLNSISGETTSGSKPKLQLELRELTSVDLEMCFKILRKRPTYRGDKEITQLAGCLAQLPFFHPSCCGSQVLRLACYVMGLYKFDDHPLTYMPRLGRGAFVVLRGAVAVYRIRATQAHEELDRDGLTRVALLEPGEVFFEFEPPAGLWYGHPALPAMKNGGAPKASKASGRRRRQSNVSPERLKIRHRRSLQETFITLPPQPATQGGEGEGAAAQREGSRQGDEAVKGDLKCNTGENPKETLKGAQPMRGTEADGENIPTRAGVVCGVDYYAEGGLWAMGLDDAACAVIGKQCFFDFFQRDRDYDIVDKLQLIQTRPPWTDEGHLSHNKAQAAAGVARSIPTAIASRCRFLNASEVLMKQGEVCAHVYYLIQGQLAVQWEDPCPIDPFRNQPPTTRDELPVTQPHTLALLAASPSGGPVGNCAVSRQKNSASPVRVVSEGPAVVLSIPKANLNEHAAKPLLLSLDTMNARILGHWQTRITEIQEQTKVMYDDPVTARSSKSARSRSRTPRSARRRHHPSEAVLHSSIFHPAPRPVPGPGQAHGKDPSTRGDASHTLSAEVDSESLEQSRHSGMPPDIRNKYLPEPFNGGVDVFVEGVDSPRFVVRTLELTSHTDPNMRVCSTSPPPRSYSIMGSAPAVASMKGRDSAQALSVKNVRAHDDEMTDDEGGSGGRRSDNDEESEVGSTVVGRGSEDSEGECARDERGTATLDQSRETQHTPWLTDVASADSDWGQLSPAQLRSSTRSLLRAADSVKRRSSLGAGGSQAYPRSPSPDPFLSTWSSLGARSKSAAVTPVLHPTVFIKQPKPDLRVLPIRRDIIGHRSPRARRPRPRPVSVSPPSTNFSYTPTNTQTFSPLVARSQSASPLPLPPLSSPSVSPSPAYPHAHTVDSPQNPTKHTHFLALGHQRRHQRRPQPRREHKHAPSYDRVAAVDSLSRISALSPGLAACKKRQEHSKGFTYGAIHDDISSCAFEGAASPLQKPSNKESPAVKVKRSIRFVAPGHRAEGGSVPGFRNVATISEEQDGSEPDDNDCEYEDPGVVQEAKSNRNETADAIVSTKAKQPRQTSLQTGKVPANWDAILKNAVPAGVVLTYKDFRPDGRLKTPKMPAPRDRRPSHASWRTSSSVEGSEDGSDSDGDSNGSSFYGGDSDGERARRKEQGLGRKRLPNGTGPAVPKSRFAGPAQSAKENWMRLRHVSTNISRGSTFRGALPNEELPEEITVANVDTVMHAVRHTAPEPVVFEGDIVRDLRRKHLRKLLDPSQTMASSSESESEPEPGPGPSVDDLAAAGARRTPIGAAPSRRRLRSKTSDKKKKDKRTAVLKQKVEDAQIMQFLNLNGEMLYHMSETSVMLPEWAGDDDGGEQFCVAFPWSSALKTSFRHNIVK